MLRIAIIMGSTRPGRKAEAVAKWAYEIARKRGDAEFELVDIKDYNLPLLDEPMSPMMGQYTQDHTKRWSAKIGSFDAYVFVTPEYNHATSGALKNAIDFPLLGMGKQGGGIHCVWRRIRYSCGGKSAIGNGRVAGRRRAGTSRALSSYGLRELHRLQARCRTREGGKRHARPGHRLGRSVEDTAGEVRPADRPRGRSRKITRKEKEHRRNKLDAGNILICFRLSLRRRIVM